MVDVNMSDATTSASTSASTAAESIQLLALLRHNLSLLERSVKHLEPRFTSRVLRTLTATRKRDERYPNVLATAVVEGTQPDSVVRQQLLSILPEPFVPQRNSQKETPITSSDSMDVDSTSSTTKPAESKSTPAAVDQPHKPVLEASAELDAYLRLLVVILLVDSKKIDQVSFIYPSH